MMKRLLVEGIPGKCLQKAQLTGNPVKGENTNGTMAGPAFIETAGIFEFTYFQRFMVLWY